VWDLWRWDRALCGNGVLDAAARRELFTPGPGDYALGWFVRDMGRGIVQRHGGSVRGFLTELRRYPADDGFLCVLCRRTSGPFGQVVNACESILSGAKITVPAPLPLAAGRELIGTWVGPSAHLSVGEREGTLHVEVRWTADATAPATHAELAGPDLARLALFDWSETVPVRVVRAGGGKVARLVLRGQGYERQ
jgi:hypothetical protein